jgi:hypothetical protein
VSEKAIGVNGASPYELLRGLCGVFVRVRFIILSLALIRASETIIT